MKCPGDSSRLISNTCRFACDDSDDGNHSDESDHGRDIDNFDNFDDFDNDFCCLASQSTAATVVAATSFGACVDRARQSR